MTTATLLGPKLTAKWRKLLRLIPDYDPVETARDCWFDIKAAQLAMDFFPVCLTHIKGPKAGKPFILEPWQQCVVANLFGWKRENGTRRYRESLVYVPRKNGKTAWAAGIALYGLLCDGEAGAEIYSAAADREQAKLVFDWAKGMTLESPELRKRCKIYKNAITALDEDGNENGSYYKPISKESSTKHGYNSHIVVVDELHAQKDRELVDVLETSMGSRMQPLMLHITTADYARPSICNEKYEYAGKVRDGIIEDMAFLPVIYEAQLDDDWTDPKIWAKANPNLGVSLTHEYMEAKCKKAQDSPSFENTFKRLHLNIQTEQDVRWLSMKKWDACDEVISEADLIGRECFAGVDLSTNTDVTARVMLFPLEDDKIAVICRFYIPEDNAREREKKDRVPYLQWAKDGYITLTPGNVVDYEIIKRDLEADWEKFSFRELAFDRWNFEFLRQRLVAAGIPEEKLISFGMGFVSMSAPTKELEKLVLGKKLIHNNNPVLRWMASNVSVEFDSAGNIKPSKKKSFEKIDGIVALIMGLGRAICTGDDIDYNEIFTKAGI